MNDPIGEHAETPDDLVALIRIDPKQQLYVFGTGTVQETFWDKNGRMRLRTSHYDASGNLIKSKVCKP